MPGLRVSRMSTLLGDDAERAINAAERLIVFVRGLWRALLGGGRG